jgi:hypothetical protein
VPIAMRPRAGGQPSSRRFDLGANYLRLLIAIISAGYRHTRQRGRARVPEPNAAEAKAEAPDSEDHR